MNYLGKVLKYKITLYHNLLKTFLYPYKDLRPKYNCCALKEGFTFFFFENADLQCSIDKMFHFRKSLRNTLCITIIIIIHIFLKNINFANMHTHFNYVRGKKQCNYGKSVKTLL